MMKRASRQLVFERFEQRWVLSSSGLIGGAVSAQAYVAQDDITAAANDLGAISGNVALQEYVGKYDQRDLYRFTLDQDAEVSLSLNDGTDADLFLLDRNRYSIRDIQPEWQKGNRTTGLAAGEYFIKVERQGSDDANYTLNVNAAMLGGGGPGDLAGNTFAGALDIGILATNATYHDFVGQSDSADAFQFEITANSEVAISLTGLTGDADLYLFSEDKQRVGQSQKEGTADEFLKVSLDAGTYIAAVAPHLDANANYSITLAADGSLLPPVPGGATPLPDVPYYGTPIQDWGLNAINAPEAWAAGHTGAGVVVAIVDTGVQLNHVDLVGNMWTNPGEVAGDGLDNDGNGYVDDVHGYDFVYNDGDPSDEEGHGTHVAGTVAAMNNAVGHIGVAYDAEIMAVRVLDEFGTGSNFDVAAGIRYAVENGADIINLSLGGPAPSNLIYSALQFAQQNDVLIVAASGNEAATSPIYPARYAADLPNVLSVGAFNEALQLASFSNRTGNTGAVQIDAPGEDIYSTMMTDAYGLLSGTSMATPHAAGVGALILSAHPALTSIQVRNAMTTAITHFIGGSDSLGALNAALAIPVGPTSPTTVVNGVNPGLRPPADSPTTIDTTSLKSTSLSALDTFFADLADA